MKKPNSAVNERLLMVFIQQNGGNSYLELILFRLLITFRIELLQGAITLVL